MPQQDDNADEPNHAKDFEDDIHTTTTLRSPKIII